MVSCVSVLYHRFNHLDTYSISLRTTITYSYVSTAYCNVSSIIEKKVSYRVTGIGVGSNWKVRGQGLYNSALCVRTQNL